MQQSAYGKLGNMMAATGTVLITCLLLVDAQLDDYLKIVIAVVIMASCLFP